MCPWCYDVRLRLWTPPLDSGALLSDLYTLSIILKLHCYIAYKRKQDLQYSLGGCCHCPPGYFIWLDGYPVPAPRTLKTPVPESSFTFDIWHLSYTPQGTWAYVLISELGTPHWYPMVLGYTPSKRYGWTLSTRSSYYQHLFPIFIDHTILSMYYYDYYI